MKKYFFFIVLCLLLLMACAADEVKDRLTQLFSSDVTYYTLLVTDKGADLSVMDGKVTGERLPFLGSDGFFSNSASSFVPASEAILSWGLADGDVVFYRGFQKGINESFYAVIPANDGHYWNGACLYYGGFCYAPVNGENGLRMYKILPLRLLSFYVYAHLRPLNPVIEDGANSALLGDIFSRFAYQGTVSESVGAEDMITIGWLIHTFYQNLGVNLRSGDNDTLIGLEDFVEKSGDGSSDGWFKSKSPHLEVKNVLVVPGYEKVY